jgi:LemA protein
MPRMSATLSTNWRGCAHRCRHRPTWPRAPRTETAIVAALTHLLGVAEAYPELKASDNFRQLQSQLTDTEDQIQLARRYYNGAARNYNIMIEQFPSNLIASVGKFAAAPFFQIENDSDRQVPNAMFPA